MVVGEIVSHLLSRPSSPSGMGFLMTMITASAGILGTGGGIFGLIQIVSLWKIFEKAGEPPWHAIVPVLNAITLCKILGKPWTILLLFFVCCIGWIALEGDPRPGARRAFRAVVGLRDQAHLPADHLPAHARVRVLDVLEAARRRVARQSTEKSSSRSDFVSFFAPPASSLRTLATSSRFFALRSRIFSSIVVAATRR